MIRLLLGILISAAAWFEFLGWAWGETEDQIDKMQDAAFETPGAEAPVPMAVFMAALSVIAGHFTVGRLLRMRRWQTFLAMVAGAAAGAFLFTKRVE